MLSYVILDDLIFPFRDFIETMMFSYLFYYQSNSRKNLAAINRSWTKSMYQNMQSPDEVGGSSSRKGGAANLIEYNQENQNPLLNNQAA
jgi:hypothetical protein